jgi:hypothetical protein
MPPSTGLPSQPFCAAGMRCPAVRCMQALLKCGVDLEQRNKQGRTALFLAAISGQPEALAGLIREGAQVSPSPPNLTRYARTRHACAFPASLKA